MSALWGREMLAGPDCVATVRRLWTPDLGDLRNDFSGYAHLFEVVVLRHVVGNTQKNGASALGLQRVLGLRPYQTVWTWLHKLRSAMVRPGWDLLTGRVEVDETYVGGLEEGLRGPLVDKKALIVIAAQEDGKGIGRNIRGSVKLFV